MNKLIKLEELEASMFPELQGWKEKQEEIVKANPFVTIVDNKTYEEAKKNRTALVTARTTIEKQDKLIASKLTDIRKKVSVTTKELIDITQPHEDKQQEEVKRYEQIKEQERIEKERIDQERKDAIQSKIETIYLTEKAKIDNLQFDGIDAINKDFEDNLFKTDVAQFEEFELQFASKVNLIKQQLAEKSTLLTEKENQRVEAERLAKEKAEFEVEKQAKADADKKEREEREAAQKAIDKANAEKEAELKAKEKELAEKEAQAKAKEDAEKQAKADAEAKQKAEKEAKAKADAEEKRLNELKPDREKAMLYIESLRFTSEFPELKNQEIADALMKIRDGLNSTIIDFNNQILTIK
ncbi:hypothetical protein [Flavobacterium sp.]